MITVEYALKHKTADAEYAMADKCYTGKYDVPCAKVIFFNTNKVINFVEFWEPWERGILKTEGRFDVPTIIWKKPGANDCSGISYNLDSGDIIQIFE